MHSLTCANTTHTDTHTRLKLFIIDNSNYYCELYLYIVLNCSIISVTDDYYML